MPHVKLEIDSIQRPSLEKFKDRATLILKEDDSERYLPIMISSLQADLLTQELCSGLLVELMSAPGLSCRVLMRPLQMLFALRFILAAVRIMPRFFITWKMNRVKKSVR